MKFELDRNQWIQAEDFRRHHDCKLQKDEMGKPYAGAIGGRITYCFTPTGLGECVEVKCLCGASKNLTDTSEW